MTPETYRYCRYEVDGPLLTLTIDRPEVLNAMHPDAHREFADAFDRYAADPSLRVAIVTGAGERAFCVGTDLKAFDATGDHTKPATGFAGITHRFTLWKPLIAAVNGLCLGGGMEILAACDLGVAADHARFGMPEPRVGLAALGGGLLQRLPRQIGMKDAMALVLTGNRISAHEARRIGLLNDVVPAAGLTDRARSLAQEILACAPLAVQAGDVAPRTGESRVDDARRLSARTTHARKRRCPRGSEGVRTKAPAELDRTVRDHFKKTPRRLLTCSASC